MKIPLCFISRTFLSISKTSRKCKNEIVCENNILESVKSWATFSHPCLQETERERERETECTDLHTGFYARFKFALIGKKGLAKEGFSNRNPRLCGMASLQFSLGKGIRKCTQNTAQFNWEPIAQEAQKKADLADRGKTWGKEEEIFTSRNRNTSGKTDTKR